MGKYGSSNAKNIEYCKIMNLDIVIKDKKL